MLSYGLVVTQRSFATLLFLVLNCTFGRNRNFCWLTFERVYIVFNRLIGRGLGYCCIYLQVQGHSIQTFIDSQQQQSHQDLSTGCSPCPWHLLQLPNLLVVQNGHNGPSHPAALAAGRGPFALGWLFSALPSLIYCPWHSLRKAVQQ